MAARGFAWDEGHVPFRRRNVLINIGVKVVYHWNNKKIQIEKIDLFSASMPMSENLWRGGGLASVLPTIIIILWVEGVGVDLTYCLGRPAFRQATPAT